MKQYIGKKWNDLLEMQEDLECELEGDVYFGDMQANIPWHSVDVKRVKIYNDTESYILEFRENENEVELIDVY